MLFIQQHNSGSMAAFLCKGADNNLYIVTYSEDDLLSKYSILYGTLMLLLWSYVSSGC